MKFAAVMLCGLLCACDHAPEYRVPEQRPAFEEMPLPGARVVNMDEPGVTLRFVRDISPDLSSNWRWGFQRPAVRIRVRNPEGLKYVIDFSLPEITFKDTGPVTIAFTVNDHVLDRVRYESAGERHFEKAVPPSWTRAGEDAIVGAEIDKMWVAPEDGARFGFIITRIGLAKE
ncbi:MAG: hypothetical protein LAO79_23765 [Acidobacteriia bacterium]|nr:hypothetical protein [Terriglobia bacterium]